MLHLPESGLGAMEPALAPAPGSLLPGCNKERSSVVAAAES